MSRWSTQRSPGLLGTQWTRIVANTGVSGTKRNLNASAITCTHSTSWAKRPHVLHASLKLRYCTSFTVHICAICTAVDMYQQRSNVAPFSTLWTYYVQRTDHMDPWSWGVISLLSSAATVDIALRLFDTRWSSERPYFPFYVPLELLRNVNISRMSRARNFPLVSNHSVSFVPALVCTAACLSYPSPKYKVW